MHGPSVVVDPEPTAGGCPTGAGAPWEEAVIYELHVGTFTPEGTFRAAIDRLDHLAETGFTAIELMPVAQFSGAAAGATTACCPTRPTPPTARQTSCARWSTQPMRAG